MIDNIKNFLARSFLVLNSFLNPAKLNITRMEDSSKIVYNNNSISAIFCKQTFHYYVQSSNADSSSGKNHKVTDQRMAKQAYLSLRKKWVDQVD